VVSGPHVASAQFGPVPHCPHARVPPSGAAEPAVQSPFWHWLSVMHEAPPASDPGPNVHAGPLRAEHPEAETALVHASSVLALALLPGSAMSAAHALSKRAWIRARSLAGGGTPSQGAATTASKKRSQTLPGVFAVDPPHATPTPAAPASTTGLHRAGDTELGSRVWLRRQGVGFMMGEASRSRSRSVPIGTSQATLCFVA
jgi:hypothetical protein